MKTQTWLPKKRPIARTLADVPSSREKPVLCWWCKDVIRPTFFDKDVAYVCGDGTVVHTLANADEIPLYHHPQTPTKLEDIPDRWIVQAELHEVNYLVFRHDGHWRYAKNGMAIPCFKMPNNWQLTDHVAELVETEIGVV